MKVPSKADLYDHLNRLESMIVNLRDENDNKFAVAKQYTDDRVNAVDKATVDFFTKSTNKTIEESKKFDDKIFKLERKIDDSTLHAIKELKTGLSYFSTLIVLKERQSQLMKNITKEIELGNNLTVVNLTKDLERINDEVKLIASYSHSYEAVLKAIKAFCKTE